MIDTLHSKPRVCVCILNYNNGEKTVRCIESVLKQTFSEYRIIVIDNNSNDDSLTIIKSFIQRQAFPLLTVKTNIYQDSLKKNFPSIVLVESDINGGYSYGNNLGIRLAKYAEIFSHILLINNDLWLDKEFIAESVKKYRFLKQAYPDRKIALGAVEFDIKGKIIHKGFHYLHIPTGFPLTFKLYPCFRYIVGSCIFIDIEAPLLDESFFLYYDDIQYSRILIRNNYALAASERSKYIHEVGGTTKKDFQMYKIVYKSLKRFYRLNYPYFLISAVICEMSVNFLRSRIRYLFHAFHARVDGVYEKQRNTMERKESSR